MAEHANQLLLIVGLSLVGVLCGCSCSQETSPPPTVTIRGRTWKVELARTNQQRYDGLSDRAKVPEGTGMLFIYPRPQELEFCMRHCLAALDIAFLDANGTVVKTHTMRMEPYGRERLTYGSGDRAQYALEVAAGELGKAGVREGDVAEFFHIPDPAKAEGEP